MSRRVLIVDDDGAVRSDLAGAMERLGLEVVTASRGDQAIELLRRKRPEAVVIDLLLPGASGFEVAAAAQALSDRHTKEDRAPLAIFAISETFLGPRNRVDAMDRFGLVDLLPKPIDALGLAERVLAKLESIGPGSTRRDAPPETPETPRRRKAAQAAKARDAATSPRAEEGSATHTPFTDDLPDSGDLAQTLVGHLLHALWRRSETGVLKLRHGRKRKDVFFRDGEPVHVRGNIVAECLGRVLARAGAISDADCRSSVRLLKERNDRQGDILMEAGALDEERLAWGLSRQVSEKLLEVFTWSAGSYRFSASEEPPPAEATLSETLQIVVSDGIRHRMPWARVQRELTALEEARPLWGADPRLRELDLGLDPAEEEFFVHLDGERTLSDSLDDSELDDEVAERVLLAMLCLGKVELAAERDSRRTARVIPPSRRSDD